MAKYARFASASYGDSFMRVLGIDISTDTLLKDSRHHAEHISFASHANLRPDDILLSSFTHTPNDEGAVSLVHFVALDHEAKAVVLTIRGTLGIEDLLTDLKCDYAPMKWHGQEWTAHGGMLKCAEDLIKSDNRVISTLRQALESYVNYGLVLCGHSLGGGVAALLGILLSESDAKGNFVTSSKCPTLDDRHAASNGYPLRLDPLIPPGRAIHCFSYGPPASISSALRAKTIELVTSVVYGRDIVPSLSLGTLRDFQSVAVALKGEGGDGSLSMWNVVRHIVGQLSRRNPPLSTHSRETDDYLYGVLQSLRKVMKNEKLLPPGQVYHVSSASIFETHKGRIRKATRIVCRDIVDVETRFSEPVFGRGVFHHSPVYYERALNILQHGAPHVQ
jgi:pimeloyl-ACP methyl ester carboxylesterase